MSTEAPTEEGRAKAATTTGKPPRKTRGKNAPLMPEQKLERGCEWLLPLASLKGTPRQFSTRQVRQILGCTHTTVHALINSVPPGLAARRMAATEDGNGHWKIDGATLLTHMWENHNCTKTTPPPLKAAFVLAYSLIHHLPMDALRLLSELIEQRQELQREAAKALGLKLPEPAAAELKEAAGATARKTTSSAPPQQSSLF